MQSETKKGKRRDPLHVTPLLNGRSGIQTQSFWPQSWHPLQLPHPPLRASESGMPLAQPCCPGWAWKIGIAGDISVPVYPLPSPGLVPARKGQAQGHVRSSQAVFHPVPRLFVQHAVQISLSQNMESGTALRGSMSKPFQVLEKVTPLQSSDLPDSITPQKCLDENCSKQSQRKASTSPLV